MNVNRPLGKHVMLPLRAMAAVIFSLGLLSACNKPTEKPASQVAARVNKQELTVHQVNFVLQQQRGIKPEEAVAARKNTLDRLVDQELAIQKAGEMKLDRDPLVMQQIEAARREVIARAYFERVAGGAGRATDAAIQKYYAENPALFAERRVYQLQEWFVDVPEAQAEAVRIKARSAKSLNEFSDYLKASNLRFEFNQAIRSAEQLPLSSLAAFAKLNEGDVMINGKPNGLQVVKVSNIRREPVELSRARPVIEQFLSNEQKAKIIADDLKALRAAATISYVTAMADTQPAPVDAPAAANAVASAPQIDNAATTQGTAPK